MAYAYALLPKVKQEFRELGDLIVPYISEKNIEGQNITDPGLDGKDRMR